MCFIFYSNHQNFDIVCYLAFRYVLKCWAQMFPIVINGLSGLFTSNEITRFKYIIFTINFIVIAYSNIKLLNIA